MITVSTLVMYALTYTNLFALGHARYRNTKVNLLIVGSAVVVGSLALLASQTQFLIGDRAYMKGMIPHHSIAIPTSERAYIEDLRVHEVADGIWAAGTGGRPRGRPTGQPLPMWSDHCLRITVATQDRNLPWPVRPRGGARATG